MSREHERIKDIVDRYLKNATPEQILGILGTLIECTLYTYRLLIQKIIEEQKRNVTRQNQKTRRQQRRN